MFSSFPLFCCNSEWHFFCIEECRRCKAGFFPNSSFLCPCLPFFYGLFGKHRAADLWINSKFDSLSGFCVRTDMRRLTTAICSEKSVVRRCRRCANVIQRTYTPLDSTDMRRLTTGVLYKKCVVRRCRRCANVIQRTYTNLDSTDMRRLTTGVLYKKCVVRRFRRCTNVIQCTYTQTQTVQYSLLHTKAIWYSLLLLGYRGADKCLAWPSNDTSYSDQDLQYYTKIYGVLKQEYIAVVCTP